MVVGVGKKEEGRRIVSDVTLTYEFEGGIESGRVPEVIS